MRDRRPPSNPWDCGTRAANISRRRAILMAFNTPFALAGVTSSTSCITTYRRCFVHGRNPSPTAGPGTSDVVFCSLPDCCGSASTAGTLSATCRSRHVRPSARSLLAAAACPRPGPFTYYWSWHVRRWYSLLVHCCGGVSTAGTLQPLAGPGTSDLLSFFTASSLSSNCPRPSGQFVVMPTSCSALVDPFLAMSGTLPPPTTDVYFSHYRFSVPGNQRLSLHAIGSSSATACSTLSRSSKWASRPVRCSSCRSP